MVAVSVDCSLQSFDCFGVKLTSNCVACNFILVVSPSFGWCLCYRYQLLQRVIHTSDSRNHLAESPIKLCIEASQLVGYIIKFPRHVLKTVSNIAANILYGRNHHLITSLVKLFKRSNHLA